jgi:hypothetical protein
MAEPVDADELHLLENGKNKGALSRTILPMEDLIGEWRFIVSDQEIESMEVALWQLPVGVGGEYDHVLSIEGDPLALDLRGDRSDEVLEPRGLRIRVDAWGAEHIVQMHPTRVNWPNETWSKREDHRRERSQERIHGPGVVILRGDV